MTADNIVSGKDLVDQMNAEILREILECLRFMNVAQSKSSVQASAAAHPNFARSI